MCWQAVQQFLSRCGFLWAASFCAIHSFIPRWRSAEDSFLFLLFKAFGLDSAFIGEFMFLSSENDEYHEDRSH
jgi:hypothetical protein